jgi:hypothetical protein
MPPLRPPPRAATGTKGQISFYGKGRRYEFWDGKAKYWDSD